MLLILLLDRSNSVNCVNCSKGVRSRILFWLKDNVVSCVAYSNPVKSITFHCSGVLYLLSYSRCISLSNSTLGILSSSICPPCVSRFKALRTALAKLASTNSTEGSETKRVVPSAMADHGSGLGGCGTHSGMLVS